MKIKYTSLAQYLNINEKTLRELGVMNLAFPMDNRYFVDIFLLKGTNLPEFKESYDKFMEYFSTLTKFVMMSEKIDDLPWASALNMAEFKEQKGFRFGHSKSINGGNGIGAVFARQLVYAVKEILRLKIDDPEAYMFIPFIEKGIGCDRISDMTCYILREEFASYTQRILKELEFKNVKEFPIGKNKYQLSSVPWNNKEPLLFVPNLFKRRLPSGFDWEDMFDFYSLHNTYRKQVSSLLSSHIGEVKFKNKKNVTKEDLKIALLGNPNIFKGVVEDVQKTFPLDITLTKEASALCSLNPIDLGFKKDSLGYSLNVVKRICESYKDMVENKKIWSKLYQEYSPLHEEFAQSFFYAIARSYCEANNIDVSPEHDTGRGLVDFRFIKDVQDRIIVEIKLSTHRYIKSGYTIQLREYIQAEKPSGSIFIVVKVLGDYSDYHEFEVLDNYKKLKASKREMDRRVNEVEKEHKKRPLQDTELMVVDAFPKLSASVMAKMEALMQKGKKIKSGRKK